MSLPSENERKSRFLHLGKDTNVSIFISVLPFHLPSGVACLRIAFLILTRCSYAVKDTLDYTDTLCNPMVENIENFPNSFFSKKKVIRIFSFVFGHIYTEAVINRIFVKMLSVSILFLFS